LTKAYVHKDGKRYGPYNLDQLRKYVGQGNFTTADLACHDGKKWVTIADVPGFSPNDQPAPVRRPIEPRESQADSSVREKSVEEQSAPVAEASGASSRKGKIILWSGIGGVAALLVAGLLIWLLGKGVDPAGDKADPKAQSHEKKVAGREGKTLAEFLPGKRIYFWSPPPGESLQKNKRPNSVLRFDKDGPWDMGMVFSDKEVFPLSELAEVLAKQVYAVDGLQVELSGEMMAGTKAGIVFSSPNPRKGEEMVLTTEGQEAVTVTILWISEAGAPLPDVRQFDSQEVPDATVRDDAQSQRPKPKNIKASLWDATLLGWKSVVQQHVDAGTDLNEVIPFSSPPQTALDSAIEENQAEIADLLRKHGAMTVDELKAERDEWKQKLKEAHGSLMRLDARQSKWPGLETIKQAQDFQEWFRNKTGVTDVSGFFPNGTKKFGYDLAVPPEDLASLPTSPSGPFPLMWTTGLEEGDFEIHWSKDSPWGKAGGHVLFSDGKVEWYTQTLEEENFDGILIKFGKPGEDTSDFGQAIPEGWQILKSN